MAGQRQKPVDSLAFRRGGRGGQAINLTKLAGHASEVPLPPKGITRTARESWKAFWRSDVAALVNLDADLTALRRWVECLSEREHVCAELAKKPVVEGSMGQDVLNPLASYMQKLTAEIARYEDRFGMTPKSRMQLGVTFKQYRDAVAGDGDGDDGEEIEEMPDDVLRGAQ